MNTTTIQLLRNATIKLNYACKNILVDPVLGAKHSFQSFVDPTKNLNPTVDLPLSVDEITKDVDAVLVTHTHPDHFDPAAMELLDKTMPLYHQADDEKIIADAGFLNTTAVETSAKFDGIEIIRTNGVHGPESVLQYLGTVSGFVLKAENAPTVYFVGDSLYNDDVKAAMQQHKPDVVVTFSGGAIFMGETRILMDENETIQLAKDFPQSEVVAVHLEALDHCKTTREKIQTLAKNSGVTIYTPENGKVVNL